MNKIIPILRKIQIHLCGYQSETFCDCKFGGENIGSKTEHGNGCPEIRTAIDLLEEAYRLLDKAERSVEGYDLATEIRKWLIEYEQ